MQPIFEKKTQTAHPKTNQKKAAFFLPKKEGRLNHFLVSSALMPQRARTPAAPHNSFSWLPTPNGHSAITSPQGREPLPQRTVKTENSEKTCEIWKKLFIFAAPILRLAIRVSFPRGVSLHRHCPMYKESRPTAALFIWNTSS